MSNKSIVSRCKVNTNVDADTFVGIKAINGDLSVSFPLGYALSKNENDLRKDILLLLNVLSKNTDKRESEFNTLDSSHLVDFPIQSYLFVIADYYSRGYYKERETIYHQSLEGKINWSRTIQTQRAFIQDNDVYYLNFITKKHNINDDAIISLIHEYCVYESFLKIGWLFTSFLPNKPKLDVSKRKKYYASLVKKKLSTTFDDRNKLLFKNLVSIINSLGDNGAANDFRYGTYRFEYVWEAMIDKAYGVKSKEKYFPRTRWQLQGGSHENAALEPDTIMVLGDTVYVLDAKYYKYGWSGAPSHLPESTSINKQITYGEYIADSEDFRKRNNLEKNPMVYNAFLMPYDSYGKAFHTERDIHYIGSAISEWKSSDGTKPYEQVAGILLDVKSLMKNHSHSTDRIIELAELIESKIK